MPREILIQVIKEKLLLDFAVILFIYFLVILIIFKLNLHMLGINLKFKKMILNILLLMTYTTVGKQFLPGVAYSLAYIILTAVLIIILVRNEISWVKVVWSSFLGFAISGIGVLTIQTPISLHPAIGKFITTTPLGVACGATCEGICPLITYFLLKTVGISIIPPVKRKVTLLDLGNLYIFAVPFEFLYSASMQMLKNIGISPISDLIKDYLYQLFVAGSLPLVYYFVYTNTKKLHMNEVQKLGTTINKLSKIKAIDNAKSSERNPVVTPNEIKLRQFDLDSKNGIILGWIILDKTYLEISGILHLSERTVRERASDMLKKFGLKNRKELGKFAIEHDLVEIIDE
jgi:DNA-binding CsgD family transcriptional regulator